MSIEEFQRARGLVADGSVGPKTWAAVESAIYFPRKPPFKPLNQAQKLDLFGDPRPESAKGMKEDGSFIPSDAWKTRNTKVIFQRELGEMPRGWSNTYGITMHVHAVRPFLQLWELWRAAGLFPLLKTWNGSTVYRVSRSGSGLLSSHAFGIAFDVNARWNPYKRRCADVGEEGSTMELVTIANACGWYWGGHFTNSDGMHFELASGL